MLKHQTPIQVTLESTMVGPLWARAKYSEMYPDLLSDTKAVSIIERVKTQHPDAIAEFFTMEQFVDEFYGLTFLIRARTFDDALTKFINQYPEATIVNLGCGLDTTFYRVDNGKITWYDLDLPQAIEYRNQFLSTSIRNFCIAKSVFDYSWFDDVNFSKKKGFFCIAGGLFHYFPEKEVAALFHQMARKFPNGEIFFDIPSKLGNWFIKRRLKTHGIHGIDIRFGLSNPEKEIPIWSNRLLVINWFPMFAHISWNPKWKWKTRVMMRLNNWLKISKFVHVKFKSEISE